LVPAPIDELNWSGKGQHVEYTKAEEVEIPLKAEKVLGHSATALVESVICKRIRLARKTIECTRRFSREDAITEVKHLQSLQHSHIVRAVGTYLVGNHLSILIFPATEYNLETFKSEVDAGLEVGIAYLIRFCKCLASTLDFLHSKAIKHMDIKPKNILVRDLRSCKSKKGLFKVYIADFGIARSYPTAADSETDTPASFTRKYSAPEVVMQDTRGLSADVFSMGCVYVEILATIAGKTDSLEEVLSRNGDGDRSYQASIPEVIKWLTSLHCDTIMKRLDNLEELLLLLSHLLRRTPEMLNVDPSRRPSAYNLIFEKYPHSYLCCKAGPDPFEVAA
jgi:serine/threonine protein kinase